MGIPVLPPDVNESFAGFTVVGNGIRFGLAAVKNVGLGAVESIIEARRGGGPFTSLLDFCLRVDTRQLNRRAIESLIKAGAFGSLAARRSQLLEVLEETLKRAQEVQAREDTGQVSLFDMAGDASASLPPPAEVPLPDIEELPLPRLLALEKEVLGFYLSGHPLGGREKELAARVSSSLTGLKDRTDGARVTVGGLVRAVRKVLTRNGEQMAFVTLDDAAEQVDVVLFPKVLERCRNLVHEDGVVLVDGRVSWKDEEVTVVAEEVRPLDGSARDGRLRPEAYGSGGRGLFIKLSGTGDAGLLADLKETLSAHPGDTPVYLWFARQKKAVLADRRYWVEARSELLGSIEGLLGPGSVAFR